MRRLGLSGMDEEMRGGLDETFFCFGLTLGRSLFLSSCLERQDKAWIMFFAWLLGLLFWTLDMAGLDIE